MTTPWKSQGRKYCEFCDCWFADNKISINFHESGKRHKESVEKKVNEMARKGTEREHALKNEAKYLAIMEKGAKAAIAKDIKQDARMINQYYGEEDGAAMPTMASDIPRSVDEEPPLQGPVRPGDLVDDNPDLPPLEGPALPPAKKLKAGEAPPPAKIPSNKIWHEAVSPEGYTYYWNIETQQSIWTAPPGGYVSLAEQGVVDPNATANQVPAEETKQEPEQRVGGGLVQRKSWKERAYGDWSTVQRSEPKKIDWELPASTVARQCGKGKTSG